MSLIIQDSKIQHKISSIAGVLPTVPLTATTTDFSVGGWRDTDILEGEFFFNIVDSKIFSRDSSGIIQIYPPLSGGTSIQEVIYLNTYNDRPIPGAVDKIYIVKSTNKMYYYDSGLADYIMLAFESDIYWSGIIDSPSASTLQIDMAVDTMHGVNDVNTSHYTKLESDGDAGVAGAKVDKVAGMGLSTNDFSNYWLNALSGLTSSVLTFYDFDNFPESGVENTIYIDKLNQNLYYWDNGIGDYSLLTVVSDTFTTGATLSGTTAVFYRNDSNTYQLDLNGLGGLGIVNKTYDELKEMYDGSTLIPGQLYKLTDFKTLHNILDETDTYTGDSWEGSLEPLILLATSTGTFDKQVFSEAYPKDIIHYDINITNFDSDHSFFETGAKGVITYRKDTVQNVECWYDFRNVKYYRNENLVYTFGDYSNCYNTSIGKRVSNTILNNTVFSTYALGCIFGYDNYNNTFDEVCYNNIIGNNFYGNTILTYFYNNNIRSNFNTNIIGNYFYDNNIIGNNFYGNIISDYFYNNTIYNDFLNNKISIFFRFNDVKNMVDSVDFTDATHVYGDYNCEIFVNAGSSLRLKYIDSNDNDIITDLIPLDELLFRTNATSFTPTITKSGSTITWVLDGENIVKSSGQELLYTYPTNSLKNVKMKIDNFDNVYNLDFSNCGISETLNLTKFKNISKYYLHTNNLTSLILPNSTSVISHFYAYSNPALTSLNLRRLTGLGGDIRLYSNNNMSTLTLPNSSKVISTFYAYSNPSLSSLNLSGLTGLGGDIRLYSNNSLTSIILPVSTQRILKFQAYGCSNLGYVNFNPLSGSSSSGITMLLDNNNWSSAIVNHVLVDLDQIGWTGGTLFIGGNNASPDETSGGYNGTQARINLELKYWGVSI